MKRVVVHIDRLVLKDFHAGDAHAIAAGLQQELGNVFTDPEVVALLPATGEVPRLRVGGVHVEQGAIPQHLGARVAQGIGREIKK